MSQTRPIEQRLSDAARQLDEALDEDFLKFQQALLRACPALSAGEYAAVTGGYLAHAETKKRHFVARFKAALALDSHEDEPD
jgi:hypothetical protein